MKTKCKLSNRILSLALALVMVLGMLPMTGFTAVAAEAVSYIDRAWDGAKVVSTEKTVTDYTVVSPSTTTMSSGWYVVTEDVTISDYVTVSGTAYIVLCDGKTLTIVNCLRVSSGDTLMIYGQKNDTGKLLTNESLTSSGAGIGGRYNIKGGHAGNITINGGTVVANGSIQSAGIGGAYQGGAGQITINGGNITAYSNGKGAGIGSGLEGAKLQEGQTITINGGKVKASAKSGGPGIGMAVDKPPTEGSSNNVRPHNMTITINGGYIEASAKGTANGMGTEAAAIGTGYYTWGSGSLYMNGGTIFAYADDSNSGVYKEYRSPGIGCGTDAMGWDITITGGSILSKGKIDIGTLASSSKLLETYSLTNGKGSGVSLRTVSLDGAADKTQIVGISGLDYGIKDVYTHGNTLYFYLSADTDLTGSVLQSAQGCVYEWNGTMYAHTYEPADCISPQTCASCQKTTGAPLGHDFVNGFCSRSGCDVNEPAVSTDGTYMIGNAGQLYWFAEHVKAGNVTANATLTADITVNEGDLSKMTGPDASLKAWIPIGKAAMETKQYNGTFDGAGYTINGLYFYTDAFEASYGGLIGKLGRNGVVKNLTVAKSWIGATSYAGAIVGSLDGGRIDNCHNESYVGAAARIGGITGHISSGTVSNCTNRGKVGFYKAHPDIPFEFQCIGGIAGNNSGTIRMCTNYAEINGKSAVYVAGIAGQAQDGKIEYSLNMATVNGDTHTGGISGWTYNSTLTGCVSVGAVNGSAASASLTGGTNGAKFSNCYYVGDKATGYAETVSGATKITEDQLYSGEIAYSLGWGQTLDGKSLPYPGGPTIYRYYTSTGTLAYTNDEGFSCNHKDGTATCMEPAICSGCKQGYGEKNPSNHVGSNDSYFLNPDDPSTHCKGCPCGEKSNIEGHSWDRYAGICQKCNAVCGVDTEHRWYNDGGYCLDCLEPMPAEMDTDGFYKISALGQLVWFARQVNSGNNTINGKLTKNIDTVYYPIDNYEPIGRTDSFGTDVEGGFAGTFDGQGYYIYGFDQMIDPDSHGTYGIFGTIANGGVVRNFIQYSAYMSLGDGTYDIRAGLIAGQVSEGGLIENCYIDDGNLQAPKRVAGGIAGLNQGTIRSCYSYDVEITAYNNRFGGIVGDYQGGTVINCFTSFATIGSTASTTTGTLINCGAGVDEGRFASGEITYKLNGGVTDGTQPFYQTIPGKEGSIPSLYKGGKTVYGWVNDHIELYSNSLSFTLEKSLTFGEGEALNLPVGATVNLAEGVTLEVHRNTTVEATFTGSGHAYCGIWSYSTESGASYHYRTCAVEGCEEVQRVDGTHTSGEGTVTCTGGAICDFCGTSYSNPDMTNHDSSIDFHDNGFCPNGCYEPPVKNADGYYEIKSAGNLFWFAQQVNRDIHGTDGDGNKDFITAKAILTADIDLENRPWTPIGALFANSDVIGNHYAGIFDGNHKKIENLYVEATAGDTGFFGEIRGATVKDFEISGKIVVKKDGIGYIGTIGAVCGETAELTEVGQSTVSGITSHVNIRLDESVSFTNLQYIGGIAGYTNQNPTMENCVWDGTISLGTLAANGVGGIVGFIKDNSTTIQNCGSYGTIDCTGTRGGILGYAEAGASIVANCFTTLPTVCGTLNDFVTTKNCYCSSDYSAELLSSGAVAYRLGQGCTVGDKTYPGDIWGQDLDNGETKQTMPSLGGAKVYYGFTTCDEGQTEKIYTNNSSAGEEKPAHAAAPTYTLTTDGTQHTVTYSCCGNILTEDHNYENGTCVCGDMSYTYDADTNTYCVYKVSVMQLVLDAAGVSGTAENPATIKLMADMDIPVAASIRKHGVVIEAGVMTMDLNGYTLSSSDAWATLIIGKIDYGTYVPGGSQVTIMDSSEGKTGAIENTYSMGKAIDNYDTLTIDGGSFTANDVCIGNYGTLTVNDGTITGKGTSGFAIFCWNTKYVPSLIIHGGEMSGVYGAVVSTLGSVSISGGTFFSEGKALWLDNDVSSVSVTGGSFTGGECDIRAFDASRFLGVGADGTGATFPGGFTMTCSSEYTTTVNDLLTENVGYYDGNGNQITGGLDGQSIEGTVTVGCAHSGGEGTATCVSGAICDICGKPYGEALGHTDEDGNNYCDICTERLSPAFLRGRTLSLKGDIAMNFYMELSDEVLADENAYMEFRKEDGTVIHVPLVEATKKLRNTENYYVFTIPMTSKEMADVVEAQFFWSEGSTETYTYSVKTYVDNTLPTCEEEALKNLLTAMLHYGAAAQTYFSYHTDRLANEGLAAADYSGVNIEGFTAEKGQATKLLSYYGASLQLNSRTAIRFVFLADSSLQEITASCKGETLEWTREGNYISVIVDDISAKDLDESVTLTVSDGTDTMEVSYSPMSYCQNVQNGNKAIHTPELKTLVDALYVYNQAANTYFGDN